MQGVSVTAYSQADYPEYLLPKVQCLITRFSHFSRRCKEQRAEYTCPRCNTRYCSLYCYKNHSNRCTEDFYRDHAVDHLRSVTATDQQKQHMLDILQRVYDRETQQSLSSSDDDSDNNSVEGGGLSEATIKRLLERGHLNEDGELVDINQEDLSPEEVEMFHKALISGEIQGIGVWKPWWLSKEASSLQLAKDGTALIQVHEGDEEEDKDTCTTIPPLPVEPIPSLDMLTRAKPSPLLAMHIVDIIYSYCFITKRYNGDPDADLPGVLGDLMSLSSILPPPSTTTTPTASSGQTVGEVVLSCLEKACRPPISSNSESRRFLIEVLKDVVTVLQHGRSVIVTLLNDLKRIVHDAGSEVVDKTERKKVGAVEKKVAFFMAWANESSSAASVSASALLVQAQYEKHMQTVGGGEGLKSVAIIASGRKGGEEKKGEVNQETLIEEL